MTKKTKKPAYIVDITSAEDVDDIKLAFIKAKALNGEKISEDEFTFVYKQGGIAAFNFLNIFFNTLIDMLGDESDQEEQKKTPWYKKVLNWFKKPFKKNK